MGKLHLLVVAVLVTGCAGANTPVDVETESEAEGAADSAAEDEPVEQGPEVEPPAVEETHEPKHLRVAVSDDTSGGLPDLEVWIRGTGSWYPDTTFGGDVLEEAGPFPVGQAAELVVYPDGRDGTEITVELEVAAEVIAGSVRDMVTILVEDTKVIVYGTSVPGLEVEHAR